nr:ATP synthase F0 subunit 8 [Cyttopsis rosea]
MPQLIPTLWFQIFTYSWLAFLIMLPYKILSHIFPNETTPPGSSPLKTFTWNWPWQ